MRRWVPYKYGMDNALDGHETAMKHTAGPWVAIENADARSNGFIREARPTEDGRQVAVAQLTKAGRSYSELIANGRLIAAAPDLLAMLKAAARALRMHGVVGAASPLIVDIDHAIARAEGK